MRIAITGGTSGIGLALVERFQRAGHDVTCFSRANGFDISDDATVERIASMMDGFDVFISNAFSGFAQVSLLYAVHDRWQGSKHRTHVVISSMSPDWDHVGSNQYIIQKAALDRAATQLSAIASYRIINIRPGWVETPRVSYNSDDAKLDPSAIADLINTVAFDARYHVTSLTVRT